MEKLNRAKPEDFIKLQWVDAESFEDFSVMWLISCISKDAGSELWEPFNKFSNWVILQAGSGWTAEDLTEQGGGSVKIKEPGMFW